MKKKKRRQKYVYVYSRNLQRVIRVRGYKRASEVAEEGNPEYQVYCPKCDCLFGVN